MITSKFLIMILLSTASTWMTNTTSIDFYKITFIYTLMNNIFDIWQCQNDIWFWTRIIICWNVRNSRLRCPIKKLYWWGNNHKIVTPTISSASRILTISTISTILTVSVFTTFTTIQKYFTKKSENIESVLLQVQNMLNWAITYRNHAVLYAFSELQHEQHPSCRIESWSNGPVCAAAINRVSLRLFSWGCSVIGTASDVRNWNV